MGLTLVQKPAPEDDGQLIAACIAGDQQAQRVLFRREYSRVNATVYRLIGSAKDADDLVQETFIAVFRGLGRFRGDSKLSTWIDRIAVRVVFHHIRSRGKATIPLEVMGDVDAGTGSVDSQAHAREGLRRLYGALAELSPEARTAFALFAIDGRSIAEVAQLTQTSFVAAKCRIWRARREVMKRAKQDPLLAELVTEKSEEDVS